MTETIRCPNCDFLLYFGENIADRLHHRLSEQKVLEGYRNVCPRCKAPLSEETVRILLSRKVRA